MGELVLFIYIYKIKKLIYWRISSTCYIMVMGQSMFLLFLLFQIIIFCLVPFNFFRLLGLLLNVDIIKTVGTFGFYIYMFFFLSFL